MKKLLKNIINELLRYVGKLYISTESYLLPIITIIFTFLTPIKPLLLLMVLFVLLDTFFGIYVSVKLKGIKSYKSHKLFNIVPKSFFYCTTILLTFLIDNFIMDGSVLGISFLLSKAMTLFWIYIEVKSMDETSVTKLGNKSIWVLIREFMNKLKGIKKDLNELTDTDKIEDV